MATADDHLGKGWPLDYAIAALLLLGLPTTPAHAAEETPQSLQKQCDAKNWVACESLGYLYEQGDGVAQSKAKALAVYERACNGGYGKSCTRLAVLEPPPTGDAGGRSAKALQLYTRACELKDGSGCYGLASAYQYGRGVPKDIPRAFKLYEKGCDLEYGDACYELSAMFREGKSVPKNGAKSQVLYDKACELDSILCILEFNETLIPLAEACNKGDAKACAAVGSFHLQGESYLKPDEAEAAPFLERACDGNVPRACADLGWIYQAGEKTPHDYPKAVGLYQKACKAGNVYGCQQLGVMTRNGQGVAKNPAGAADLFRVACNANSIDAPAGCGFLSELYDQGLGVPKDSARASTLRAQACRLGDPYFCKATAPAPAPVVVFAKPAGNGCSVVKVQLGVDTAASVQKDIARRGGSASNGTNNGKPTFNAMSGDYSDVGNNVMAVNYTFGSSGPSASLTGVTIVHHADDRAEFDKMLAARKSATAGAAACKRRIVPNADTWVVYEIYE
jgi:TPR repeat protein